VRVSLFLKIYLTIVAGLVIVALALGLAVHLSREWDDAGWDNRRDRIIAAMFPAQDDDAQLVETVHRLHAGLDADISIFGNDGRLIVQTGSPISSDVLENRRRGRTNKGRVHLFDLPGDRLLAVRWDMWPDRSRTNLFLAIAFVAGGIGLAAWPVVRHLTRRLEALRQGVEAWGGGALVTRIPVHGNDEVAAVARSFNQAAEEIERLLRSHRALLANASHELRSPLARLRMAIDLLPEKTDGPRHAEIVRSLGELDALVEEILLASRLDHVKELESREAVDLLAIAAETAATYKLSVSGDAVMVSGDTRLLARMVRNLILNAQRHGAPPIEIEVHHVQDHAVLSVRDHGKGVPEEERSRVFEAFYRPTGRGESAGGWGLGLALVRQIAEHHGGTARCEAAPGSGARFVVEMPAAATQPR
jgi:signal transduction histidine kinase